MIMLFSIEDEIHFLLECPAYVTERKSLFDAVKKYYEDFEITENDVQLCILINDEDLFGDSARFIANAYSKRSAALTK